MKALAILSGVGLSVLGLGMVLVAQETPAPPKPAAAKQKEAAPAAPNAPKPEAGAKSAKPADDKSAPIAGTEKGEEKADPNEPPVTESSVPAKYAADEQAIRKIHEVLVKGYAADDAKAVATNFGTDGEYINASGDIFHGRKEIEESLSEYMKEHPGCKLESEIHAIRFVSPVVALVDGITVVAHEEEGHAAVHCHFAAVYAKADNKWELASVRDRTVFQAKNREEELAQLDFLLGDWIDEDDHSVVSFNCKHCDNDKFLLREFTLKIAGEELMKGSQRIGWDPLNGQLRTWIFDSEGGFAEGLWEGSGDEWAMHVTGVTADGETASGSTIYKIVNAHTMTWQLVDHEVGGEPQSDSPVYTLTRRAPAPEAVEAEPKVGKK